ncbi:MAG: haloacid dehalogenase [Bdellovibrionaceae bacterium]|nr:haloacid dehalogenase [Pseudobdellovibrionaceae bacterium]
MITSAFPIGKGVLLYQAILFDFDGVIVESVAVKGRGFARLYEDQGKDAQQRVVRFHEDHGGVSRVEKILHFNKEFGLPTDEVTLSRYRQRFSDFVLEEVIQCPFVPGAEEFLKNFSGKIPFFIVSATPENELHQILKARNLTPFFKDALGSPTKKPEHVRRLIKTHGFDPKKLLFVGDAMTDLEAAQETGVHFLGRISPEVPDLFPCTIEKSADIFGELKKRLSKDS